MCRLLGITGFEFGRHEKIIRNFCELARSGQVMPGDPPGHGDGWGMAFYRNGELTVEKSAGSLAQESEQAIEILQNLGETPVLILHLRKSAWKNTTSSRHAHPFHYRNVAFAHNGVVYGYQGLIPDITVPGLGDDALDTEVFFLHFMSEENVPPDQAFLRTVSLIKRDYRFSSLNTLFSDGTKLYAYRDYSKEPDYYSLYKAESEGSWIISSEPLAPDIRWVMMQKEEFLALP